MRYSLTFQLPLNAAKKASRGITEALNQIGSRVVGLQWKKNKWKKLSKVIWSETERSLIDSLLFIILVTP